MNWYFKSFFVNHNSIFDPLQLHLLNVRHLVDINSVILRFQTIQLLKKMYLNLFIVSCATLQLLYDGVFAVSDGGFYFSFLNVNLTKILWKFTSLLIISNKCFYSIGNNYSVGPTKMKTCMYGADTNVHRVAEDVCDYRCQQKSSITGGRCINDKCECRPEYYDFANHFFNFFINSTSSKISVN